MFRRVWLFLFILNIVFFPIYSQQKNSSTGGNDPNNNSSQEGEYELSVSERALQAISTIDYPVTPGDQYTVVYLGPSGRMSYSAQIGADYNVTYPIFGTFFVKGLTLQAFSKLIIAKVESSYPKSSPIVSLTNTGLFKVLIQGEIDKSTYESAWGLTRLSDIIDKIKLTTYASTRNVTIKKIDGTEKTYDLFKYYRFGTKSENPYLGADDTIIIPSSRREVTISGAVKRGGSYVLLDNEDLNDAIYILAGGIESNANLTEVVLRRQFEPSNEEKETIILDLSNNERDTITLQDQDTISIPSLIEKMPAFYIEGAFQIPDRNNSQVRNPELSNYKKISLNSGESIKTFMKGKERWFSESSDMENAYILRDREKLPVNLVKILEYNNTEKDILLTKDDRIIIPFKQYFVSVLGAVKAPGRYPYQIGKTWDYYTTLAGGIDTERNDYSSLALNDKNGQVKPKESIILPEDVISVALNDGLYVFKQKIPVISIFISLATLLISIVELYKTIFP